MELTFEQFWRGHFCVDPDSHGHKITYHLERLEIVSEEDWIYLSRADKHPKPAMWQPDLAFGPSLFGTEEEALRELRADPKTQGWTIPAN